MSPGPRAPAPDRRGIACGIGAFLIWGFLPLYLKVLAPTPPLDVLAHRIFWSALLLAAIVAASGRLAAFRAVFAAPRRLGVLALTALLIGVNWYLYIWSVATHHVVEASLGYFINPLVNVLLGFLVLKERLRPLQWGAVALAAAGVGLMVFVIGHPPWIALALAFSFSLYGLLRKMAPVEPLVGLAVETLCLAPVAIVHLLLVHRAGADAYLARPDLLALLMFSGPLTALPLILFAAAARRLAYATVGLIQYLAPTIQFLLGVSVFHEPLHETQLATFGLIWSGLALYALDGARMARRQRRARPAT